MFDKIRKQFHNIENDNVENESGRYGIFPFRFHP